MSPDQERFMNLHRWPAILTREQTAWVLGFQVHEISELMRKRLLRPLGNPAANGGKYFSMVEIEELGKDRRWLGRARDVIVDFWLRKNHAEIGPKDGANSEVGS
jgi:hypothetical protein